MHPRLDRVDDRIVRVFHRYGHWLHRVTLGVLFIWFGLLKPFGHETTTSIIAHTVYWGSPAVMVQVLGWWEVAIGVCLIIRPLVRIALLLLVIRLPGIVLAFTIQPEVMFEHFPLAPTPEGQYLIKDFAIFFATLAIGGMVRHPSTPAHRH